LRILFYACFPCIYLRLLVLNMVISVEDLVLCLFSLYLFTSTGLKPGYISWSSCSMFVFFVYMYASLSYSCWYQLRILFYACFFGIYLRLLVLSMAISVEVFLLYLFSLHLFTSTGHTQGYISWGSCSMFIFFVFIYVNRSQTWLYQLRILFYVCYLCICLRLLVLNMVISVEDLVLCLFSLYIFTSPCLNHVYISWGSCSMFVFFVFIYVDWS
jgi:hypothetical protein